ncbi:MAG TPA: histidine kinase N-terminal 7TM domain-containing protein [Anaerolineales bacterium]|nr:histidine kinase N-terminal 7TM domain-containing protein [Anaerolineales bacterium]
MQNRTEVYVSLIYILAAIPYVWLGLHAWRKRPAVAVTPFAWVMLGMSIWSFGYGLELFFPYLSFKLFFAKIEYIGIVSIPVLLLFFALEFTGKSHVLTPRLRLLLWIFPFMMLVLVWTNEFHQLVWSMAKVVEIRNLHLLDVRFGLFFWVHIVFANLLTVFASILLVRELAQRPRSDRVQIGLVILGIFLPLIGSLLFVFGLNPIPNFDITPLLFLPTGLGLSWAIVRYRLQDTLPLEHLSVLNNMKDGVIVLNSKQRVLYLNPIAEKLLGCGEDTAIGQPLAHVSALYWGILRPHLTAEDARAEVVIGEGRQTTVFDVTVSPIIHKDQQQRTFSPDCIITLHDITERKEMENALSRREAIMSAVSMSAEQFLKEGYWGANVLAVLEKVGQAVNVSRVYVAMNYKDEKNTLYSSMCYEWVSPEVVSQINNPALRHIPLQQAGLQRWEKQLSQHLSIQGLVEDFPESEHAIFKLLGSLSVAAMPIFVDNEWWGFVVFDECRTRRHWTGMELKTLHTIASILGSAESRTRAEQKLIRRQNTLTLLHQIVQEALQADNLKAMAEDLVGRLTGLISADDCYITVWDEAASQTSPLASFIASRNTFIPLQPVFGEFTLTELALNYKTTLIVEDVANSPYFDREIAEQCPAQSLLAIPLVAGKNRLGAIILTFNLYHRFQAEEIEICTQASNLIALAFEKFKAMEYAQRRAVTSETLRKASAVVSGTLEMDEAVNHILEQLNRVVPYDSASIQLLDGNELEIVGGRGWENVENIKGMRFEIPGDNPNSVVIETKKPYILADVRKAHKAFSQAPHDHIRSWLGVPLVVRDRVIGLLSIDSAEENHFNSNDIELAVTFANQVSITLENARIFKETQDQAIIDPLTTIYNRRGLYLLGGSKFEDMQFGRKEFSCIMIDIDHFKKINDTHGHDAGDRVLVTLASFCKKCVREIDIVGRYGGEEIVILLPETSLEVGMMVAERLRAMIAGSPVKIGENFTLSVTASLGVACKDENTTSLDILIKRADQAMYIAKNKGRNRVATSR